MTHDNIEDFNKQVDQRGRGILIGYFESPDIKEYKTYSKVFVNSMKIANWPFRLLKPYKTTVILLLCLVNCRRRKESLAIT